MIYSRLPRRTEPHGHGVVWVLLLASAVLFPMRGRPQDLTQCKASPDLERAVAVRPDSATYNVLGVYFARRKGYRCAIPALQKALELNSTSWEAHYNLALALQATGDLNGAKRELRESVAENPKAAKLKIAYGEILHSAGELDAAVAQYKEALTFEPNSTDALYDLGQILSEQGSFTAAIYYLHRGVKIDPRDPSLQLALGIALSKNDQNREAIEVLHALVVAHPDFAPAHFNLATAYTKERQYTEAAKEYGQDLKLEPENDEARISQANALITMGLYTAAVPLVRDYIRRKPKDYVGYFEKAQIDRGLGDYEEAEKELRRAFELKPDGDYGLHFELGVVLEKLGHLEEAKQHLETAQKLDPHSEEARFHLASVFRKLHEENYASHEYQVFNEMKSRDVLNSRAGVLNNQGIQLLSQGDARGAAAAFRESVRLNPADAKQFYNLAVALNKVRDDTGERQALDQAIRLDPDFYKAHNLLGLLLLGQGDRPGATAAFQAALKAKPRFAEAENNLGVIYGQEGKYPQAEELLHQAVQDDPDYAQAFVNLALVLATEEKYEAGERAIKEALRIAPDDAGALTALGTLQNKLNQKLESIETFQRVTTFQPDSAEAHLNLGLALADGLDMKAALAEFSTAVRLSPRANSTHYNKGRILLCLGRNAEAISELQTAGGLAADREDRSAALYLEAMAETGLHHPDRSTQLLKEAIRQDPDSSDARFLLGEVLSQLGDTHAACEQWKRLVETNPHHAEVLYRLSHVLAKTSPAEAKHYAELLADLERRRGISSDSMRLQSLALDAAKANDQVRAREFITEALKVCGNCDSQPSLHGTLGLIYSQCGDLDNGERELQRASELSPGDIQISQALALVKSAEKRSLPR